MLVPAVPTEEWRRDEQLYDLRKELSPQAPHAEDVTQQHSQAHAGLRQHLTGLVQEKSAISRNV